MRRMGPRIVWGLALILVGVGFLLSALGVESLHNLLAHWWPVIFLVIALADLLARRFLNAASWLIFGIVLGLFTTGLIAYNGGIWSIIWPLALVLLGLRLIFRPAFRRGRRGWRGISHYYNWRTGRGPEDSAGFPAVFGDVTQTINSEYFTGSTIGTVFGEARLDLRNATLAEEGAVIDISSVFGDVELLVPKKTPVKTDLTTLFGEYTDKRDASEIDATLPAITLRGNAVFGDLDISD